MHITILIVSYGLAMFLLGAVWGKASKKKKKTCGCACDGANTGFGCKGPGCPGFGC